VAIFRVQRTAVYFDDTDTGEVFEAVEAGYHGMFVWVVDPVSGEDAHVQVERNPFGAPDEAPSISVFQPMYDAASMVGFVLFVQLWLEKRDRVTTAKFAQVPWCVGVHPMSMGGLLGA